MLRKIHKKQGFTLVEIMIVVGIVTLLAALSTYSLLRAKINSNDGAALASIKSIAVAEESYRLIYNVYTTDFSALVNDRPPHLSAFSIQAGEDYVSHQGYNFYIPMVCGDIYRIYGQPQHYGVTGTKFIVCDQSGVQRFDNYLRAQAYVVGGVICGPPPNYPPPPPGYEGG